MKNQSFIFSCPEHPAGYSIIRTFFHHCPSVSQSINYLSSLLLGNITNSTLTLDLHLSSLNGYFNA